MGEVKIQDRSCKICGGKVSEAFRIPKSKVTGHTIPEGPDDCIYYECTHCQFCFTELHDRQDHRELYGEDYWNTQDPDWYGRISETLRLILLANSLLNKNPWHIEILDFGCGMGTFVQSAREKLNMKAWGHDIIEPKFGKNYFLKDLSGVTFDVIVCCEVLEHLSFPVEILLPAIQSLKPNGVFAFQTAYYDPDVCGRDWWYVGPANGHVSLYSVGALNEMFKIFGGKKKLIWDNYPGIQAWQFDERRSTSTVSLKNNQGTGDPIACREAISERKEIKIKPQEKDFAILMGTEKFHLNYADLMEGIKQMPAIMKQIGFSKISKTVFKIAKDFYRK